MQKEVNMKGEHLVVGSLEVLEEMSGAGVQAIRQGVQSAQDLIVKVSSRAEKFYKDAASDNIITPEEKKTLKRDFIEIQRTYSAILYQAEIKGLSDDPRIIGLTDAYDDLYGYLYTTIRVFEDMSANTVISSSEDMNEYYDTYFDAEMFAQAVLTQTALAYVRVLSSLDDPGLSNELGYYKGQLYRYVVNEGWQAVSSGDYMGVVSSASALAEKGDVPDGSFFLCGSSFIVAEYRLTTSEGVMTTDGGNHFALTVRADAGDVWALEGGVWRRVPDRNDWRYILATNDLVALGFPISPSLEGEIRSVAKDAALELSPGKYLGRRTADPVSPALGEYYLYIGNTTLTRKNGALYKYMRTSGGTAAWTELSSEDPANYQNYMAALSDMLAEDEQSLDTGRFSVVFARTLASMSAMIETLMAQTMILKSGGVFKSEGFDSGMGAGFRLSADGVLEAREGVFSGTVETQNGIIKGTLTAQKMYCPVTAGSVIFRKFENKVVENGDTLLLKTQVFVSGSLRFSLAYMGSAYPDGHIISGQPAGSCIVQVDGVQKALWSLEHSLHTEGVVFDVNVGTVIYVQISTIAPHGPVGRVPSRIETVSWHLDTDKDMKVIGGIGNTFFTDYDFPVIRPT